jgi:hypothetical protein
MNGVEVAHNCGHVLGTFVEAYPSGYLVMECPKCKKKVHLEGAALDEVIQGKFERMTRGTLLRPVEVKD